MPTLPENALNGDNGKQIISNFFKNHNIIHLLKQCGAHKQKGISVGVTLQMIFSALFTGKSLHRCLDYDPGHLIKKDTVYRLLNLPSIDWTRFLLTLSQQVIGKILPLTSENRRSVFIIDDSFYDRSRSRKTELLSRVYDHARHIYGYGYRLLTLGWSDGNTFIPVNFCLMSSQNPSKRLVEAHEHAYAAARSRREMAIQYAPDTTIALLEQAKRAGIQASHVLVDSWFSFPSFILRVSALGYHCVAMVKKSQKIYYEFEGYDNR